MLHLPSPFFLHHPHDHNPNKVDRKGDKAVHFVSGGEDPLQEGQPVLQKVDWNRRWVVSMPYEFMMVSMIINIVGGNMLSKCPKPILQKVDWARR